MIGFRFFYVTFGLNASVIFDDLIQSKFMTNQNKCFREDFKSAKQTVSIT